MLYAKIVVGLPVQGPFDYSVERQLQSKIKPGCRVRVPWRNQRKIGYVVGLSRKTSINKVKSLISLLDESPALDKNMLLLTRKLSDYYCCSWGEAIEISLPQQLRKGKALPELPGGSSQTPAHINGVRNVPIEKQEDLLVHDPQGNRRWDVYFKAIEEALNADRNVLLLFPDKNAVLKASRIINSKVKAPLSVLSREGKGELQEWARIKQGRADIVIGSRSAIFAPLSNLGLVIIDEEQDYAYKQDQSPHYHARVIALMRASLENARLILGSTAPSLDSFYLTQKKKIKYLRLEGQKSSPEIKTVDARYIARADRKRGIIISRYMQDALALALDSKSKVFLFLNRRGFATVASCISCGLSLKCPRCSINLVYHFKDNTLSCHYCNFKMQLPSICPQCNAGYIKYSGTGAEKIESELSRIFPQARIVQLEQKTNADIGSADIFISTQGALRGADYNFDFIGVLGIDNSLNRADLAAAEKTFQLLSSILRLTDKKALIQTSLPKHHIFVALLQQDPDIFYKNELLQRKQLHFPPYQHLGLVRIRGKNEGTVKEAAQVLFQRFKQAETGKNISIISVNCAQPAKLRGNFYWQILIRSGSAVTLSRFLKIHLKYAPRSGIITTVDIDPV
ncbi:MAG: primosomal protein N' [Candidatus Omnitrophica bacterium]|nr:primosomal protein N' [Candidatus Omnitrophota bacterium]